MTILKLSKLCSLKDETTVAFLSACNWQDHCKWTGKLENVLEKSMEKTAASAFQDLPPESGAVQSKQQVRANFDGIIYPGSEKTDFIKNDVCIISST